MEENLIETISWIKQLAEENQEFKQAMQELFGKTTSGQMYSDDRKMLHILQYLGLDVYVDNMHSIIDYSFISEEYTRDRLISDNREMIRYRYGTRYHETLFEEYCRYAQFQAEMLLNYYYSQKGKTLDKIKDYIKKYTDSKFHAKINESKSLHGISFNNKYWAFAKELNLMDIIDPLDYISRVRNSQSHRSPEKEKYNASDFIKKLHDYKIKILEDGTINWSDLYKNPLAKNLFETKIKGTPEYKEYSYHIWLNKTPYDEITDILKKIATNVKQHIS